MDYGSISPQLGKMASDGVGWGTVLLEEDTSVRGDYKYLLELILIYLGTPVYPFKVQ